MRKYEYVDEDFNRVACEVIRAEAGKILIRDLEKQVKVWVFPFEVREVRKAS